MGKQSGRLRALTWGDYGISDDRYKELKHFCLQYPEKQKRAKGHGKYGLPAANMAAARTQPGCISNPTESAAVRNYLQAQRAFRDCRLIEESAMWAAGAGGFEESWRALLHAVTRGAGYRSIAGLYDLPFGETDFYGIRRAFFYRLDRLQNGEES